MSKPVVPSIARSLARRDAPRIIGEGYKNPIAFSRNFEGASWWRSACHKPDLPSGFVKFMRIGETVYGKGRRRVQRRRSAEGTPEEEAEGGRREPDVGGRKGEKGHRKMLVRRIAQELYKYVIDVAR